MKSVLIFLLLLVAGLLLIGLRFLSFRPDSASLRLILTIAGGVLAAAGLTGYIVSVVNGIRPKDAIILTNKGFTNLLIGGKEGVYVEWTQVRSLRIFGLRKSPMLGLSLVDEDAYLQQLFGKDLKEAEYNRSIGLPVIAIAQKDVKSTADELKNLFSKMIKGAISWENYMRQERKSSAPAPERTSERKDVPASSPERPEFKSFAERRREAEQMEGRGTAGRAEQDDGQMVLFPETSEEIGIRHTESIPFSRTLFGDEDADPEIGSPEENSDTREMEKTTSDTKPVGITDAAGHSFTAPQSVEEDDEIFALEDDDEPIPILDEPETEPAGSENPFSAFDKAGSDSAVTILDIDEDE